MSSKAKTQTGQNGTPSVDDDGRRMAAEAQREIERRGLSRVLAASYIAEQGIVRLGQPSPSGPPARGIDYPAHPSYLALLIEHLQVLARTRTM